MPDLKLEWREVEGYASHQMARVHESFDRGIHVQFLTTRGKWEWWFCNESGTAPTLLEAQLAAEDAVRQVVREIQETLG